MNSKVPDFLEAGEDGGADDNIIQTFRLEETLLRGRAVRIGSVLNDILEPHDYPEPVAQLVAEMIALAPLLSSMLKYEGIFTLQTRGDGPANMLVADVTTGGIVRGCASFDADKIKEVPDDAKGLAPWLGKGYLVFTVDQGGNTERYQGIVELNGDSLVDCVQHYFNQSEQIGTGIKLAAGKRGRLWRAGAIMLQHMPEQDKGPKRTTKEREEDWNRTMALLSTCTNDELLNPSLHSNALLYRLFHEEGVRVYKPSSVEKGCRCDEHKVETMLLTMNEDDITYMAKDGKIHVKCEFCSREYTFDPDIIKSKLLKK